MKAFENKLWPAAIFVIIGASLVLYGALKFDLSKPSDLYSFGGFCSGTVAPLWSLAGLLFVYEAFLGQVLQVQTQMQQLELAKEETQLNKAIISETRINNTKQQFESTFFSMLSLHNNIVSSMELTVGAEGPGRIDKTQLKGRDCFQKFYAILTTQYEGIGVYRPEVAQSKSEEELIEESYIIGYSIYQSHIGHYFRNIYQILKLIKHADIPDKRLYSNILRAQLSSNELLMLFYNGLSSYGSEKLKPLVEEFSLLKTVPFESLIKKSHKDLYNHSAFAGR